MSRRQKKISRTTLLGRLAEVGLPDVFLDFLSSYLLPREGRVCVENACSDAFAIADTVFQGTVLGPPLWNVFFAPVVDAIQDANSLEKFVLFF